MARTSRATASTVVDRDLEDVFVYISEPARVDDWVVGVSNTRLVSGDGGAVGDVYEYDSTDGGRTVPMRVEVTDVDSPGNSTS